MKNKGQVEVQFNWIFILIVGAIILAFFASIALTQKKGAEQGVKITFLTQFDRALSGIAAVEGKTLLFDVPNMDVHYDCTACDCVLYVGQSRAKPDVTPLPVSDKIVFAPNSLKGNSLLASSKEWDFPFKTSNFLLLTSPEIKYLVETGVEGDALYDELPPQFLDKETQKQSAFDKDRFDPLSANLQGITGNYKIKFVFLTSDPEIYHIPSQALSLPDSDVTAVKLDVAHNKVTFYEKRGSTQGTTFTNIGDSYLFGEATVFGAVIAEDKTTYTCMMDKAFNRLTEVAKVYAQKQKFYSNSTQLGITRPDCKINYFPDAITSFISKASLFKFADQNQDISIVLDAQSITTQNRHTLENSCPQIY